MAPRRTIAHAEILDEQLPHTQRAQLAAEAGPGIGVVKFNGLWGVSVSALPTEQPLRIVGVAFDEGEWEGRWQHVDLIVDEQARVTSEHEVQGAMVDAGLLCFADPTALADHGREKGHHERLVDQLERSEQDAVSAREGLFAFANRWGDGIYTLSRLCDADGRTLRVRAKLGTPQIQSRMRQVWMRSLGCIVTKKVIEDGAPIRFAERMEPNNDGDSGWFLCSGLEDDAYMSDASNFAIVAVGTAVSQCEPFAKIILAPVGKQFTLVDGVFVED